MRKLIGLMALVVALSYTQDAEAEFLGSQLFIAVGASVPIEPGLSVSLSTAFMYLGASQIPMVFPKIGIRNVITDWFNTTLSVGMSGNFPAGRTGLVLTSVNQLRFYEGHLVLFASLNLITTSDSVTYFGEYSADWARYSWFNIGFHAEQINTSVTFGPHIGLTARPFHFEFGYYVGVQDINEGHSLRTSFIFNF